jgi:hypothetical protein
MMDISRHGNDEASGMFYFLLVLNYSPPLFLIGIAGIENGDEDLNMMNIFNDGEDEDQNSIAKSLVASINASHHLNILPKTKSHQTASGSRAPITADDSDSEPLMNKTPMTARALRAERNLGNTTRRLRNLPITSRRPLRHHLIRESDRDSEDEADHDGDSTPNETTNLDAGNSNASKGHGISPIHPKKLGSIENPIDVDSIASLFEPTATKEYVWNFFIHFAYASYAEYILQMKKESISFSLDINPPIIKGKKSYTVFDVEGNPESFTPSFHVSH